MSMSMSNFSVLGGDYEEGYADGKAGKSHATSWGFLRKGAYEQGYNAGLKARSEEQDKAYTESDLMGVDAADVKFATNFASELANRGMEIYERATGKKPTATTPTTTPTTQQQPVIVPPKSGNFLTEMRGGAPTYVWILGGGLTLTGAVLVIKGLLRRR